MVAYFIDLTLVALFVISITALMGVFMNGIGENILGRKNRTYFVDRSNDIQVGWRKVGGNGIIKKKTY